MIYFLLGDFSDFFSLMSLVSFAELSLVPESFVESFAESFPESFDASFEAVSFFSELELSSLLVSLPEDFLPA